MHSNYVQFNTPQFRLLSDKQLEELHLASLQILERIGATFDCREAIDLLGDAGADVSDHKKVKIPSYLVEQALRTAPKTITLYTRDGEPAIVLNGMTWHFGGQTALDEYLDPYSRQRRQTYVEDIGEMARLLDGLPNIEWVYNVSDHSTVPGAIADKVGFTRTILNTSKPVACQFLQTSSVEEMFQVAAMVAGGEKELKARPFFVGTSLSVSPFVHGKDALEKSLLCAGKGIPIMVYSMPMAGTTAPATLPAVLAIANAEFLGQLVAIQLKRPGAPVIYGSQPSIMDMRTTIYSFGAPEAHFLDAAIAELSHYYGLPFMGTAGQTDAEKIDAQAAIEATYQIMLGAFSGADFIHGIGEMYVGRMMSPEYAVLGSEIIDMVRVAMQGFEINAETLPLDLMERIGPGGNYLSEDHTLRHFRKFWVPRVFDRSMATEAVNQCGELLNKRTLEILKTHQPKPLSDDVAVEIGKIETDWLKEAGLEQYPKRP